nr:tetratricopeptide repeat protein [Lactobacillus amylovorus]
KYVDEPDSFASDLVSFLQTKEGRSHQKLFNKIYQHLPK